MTIINEPTVFVLGAGASQPFGFPSGDELRLGMIESLGNQINRDNLVLNEFEPTFIQDFQDTLELGNHRTIDTLLEKKSEFREIGSYVIATRILACERSKILLPQKDWYSTLWEALKFENEKPDTSNLSVITFNYDRSFEYFLEKNINVSCTTEKVEFAHNKRKRIHLIHPHGSLGDLNKIGYGGNGGRPTPEIIHKSSKNINIVSDDLDESEEFIEAQNIISKTEHVVFFGLGYEEKTVKRLLEKSEDRFNPFTGTALGADEPKMKRIKETFENCNNEIHLFNLNCDKLLMNLL